MKPHMQFLNTEATLSEMKDSGCTKITKDNIFAFFDNALNFTPNCLFISVSTCCEFNG